MSGDELAVAIKDRSPKTPVIILTGFGDLMRNQSEHPAGVDRIIAKPITHRALQSTLAEMMDDHDDTRNPIARQHGV